LNAFDPEAELAAAGRAADDDLNVGRAALALAALGRPEVALERYAAHLDTLASEVSAAAGPAETAAQLGHALDAVIAGKHSYRGDELTYDDPQNANLMRVIVRRRGLPVALGVLYMHAGRAQGWDVAGLAFPSHFLIRVQHRGERAILDPFNKGRQLDTAEMRALIKRMMGEDAELQPAHWNAVSARDVLLRLQNNIKTRALQADDAEAAAAALRSMLRIAPRRGVLHRELALVERRTGNLKSALEAAQHYLQLADGDRQRHDAALLLQQLRSQLN
jgi:regulator of sirC expression with transglutaminase-like and TPR domain